METKQFFTIKSYQQDFDGIKFCLAAINPNIKNRYNLECLRVTVDGKTSEAAGTDGRRLHLYRLNGVMDAGFYKIEKNKAKEIVLEKIEGQVWPDTVKQIIPDKIAADFAFRAETIRAIYGPHLLQAIYGLNKKDIGINPDLLTPLLAISEWVIYGYGPNKPVYFEGYGIDNNKRAVIMPSSIPPVEYIEPTKQNQESTK